MTFLTIWDFLRIGGDNLSRGQRRYDDAIMVSLNSLDKCKIYEIALDEDTSVSAVVRKFIKKGLIEYEREKE